MLGARWSPSPIGMTAIEIAIQQTEAVAYARQFIGTPYIWGGDDPIEGFDCSGFIHEILQAFGLEPRGFDSTAHDLYWRLITKGCQLIEPKRSYSGCLVFWMNDHGRMTHTALVAVKGLIVHAAGGGSTTTDLTAAARQNAYIRLDRLDYRGGDLVILDPWREGEGG